MYAKEQTIAILTEDNSSNSDATESSSNQVIKLTKVLEIL